MNIERITIRSVLGTVSEISPECVPGVNDPFLAIGVTQAGRRVEVVLKPTAPWTPRPGIVIPGEMMNLREVICSLLLRSLGFPCPEPFIVVGADIPWDYLVPAHATRLSAVPHFATELVKNARECAPRERLSRFSANLRTKAEELFAADNMILNCDRTRDKPNLLWRSGELIPIDHGLAFHLLLGTPGALAIPTDRHREHVAYEIIESPRPNFSDALRNWSALLTPQTLDAIEAALPTQWIADRAQLSLIRTHLESQPARVAAVEAALMQTFRP